MAKKYIVIIFLILIFLFSSYNIFLYINEKNANEKVTDELIDKSISIPDNDSDSSLPFVLDFEELHKENQDIIAWLYCENTPINYPIVKCNDNEYYLNHSINGDYNKNGSLFVDNRCGSDFTGFNTIIYGHNMKTDKMFGSLIKYKNQSYYEEHPILYLLTPKCNYKVELLAGYVTSSNSNTYNLLETINDKKEFIDYAIKESTFNSVINADVTDAFITLSTCSYEYSNARYVVVGKLNKI